jgi:hypothetical protein
MNDRRRRLAGLVEEATGNRVILAADDEDEESEIDWDDQEAEMTVSHL